MSTFRGNSDEEAVRVLFEGLAQEKLYIGPMEIQKQSPKILDVIQKQAENIVKELNPEHPGILVQQIQHSCPVF